MTIFRNCSGGYAYKGFQGLFIEGGGIVRVVTADQILPAMTSLPIKLVPAFFAL
jgi:hypothetical protein